MAVTVRKLDGDIIYAPLNIGSAWTPRNEGCRLTHIPTKSVIECIDYNTYHKNREACEVRLAQILKYPAN